MSKNLCKFIVGYTLQIQVTTNTTQGKGIYRFVGYTLQIQVTTNQSSETPYKTLVNAYF